MEEDWKEEKKVDQWVNFYCDAFMGLEEGEEREVTRHPHA
jgi:hypothetical protein